MKESTASRLMKTTTNEFTFASDWVYTIYSMGYRKARIYKVCGPNFPYFLYYFNTLDGKLYKKLGSNLECAIAVKNGIIPLEVVDQMPDLIYDEELEIIYHKSERYDLEKSNICKGYTRYEPTKEMYTWS